ncbi:TonB-dependent receptor [Phenylobacterium sp.]|uniref:TonB-dependent receptor n=1 Tax=Phenylobacterium sp. TaxID=1871053 RepID=UPI00301CE5EE
MSLKVACCRSSGLGLMAVAVLAGGGAAAAEAADQAVIEEVVVTAQRREESLQKVPVAVTALSSEKIADSNILSSQELDVLTPGLVTTTVNGNAQTYIRGVGSQSTVLGTESSVATYVDGVYIASTSGAVFSLNNIARVEVLRGPQGTLFGRNATGGVIQVVTRKPQQEPTLNASVTYMNYETAIASVYGSMGLTDTISASLAVYGQDQGKGYGRNIFLDQKINYTNEFATRGQLLFEPGERITVLISADYDRQRNDMGTNRQTLAGTRTILGGQRVGGPYDANYDFPVFARSHQWGVSQDASLDLGFGVLRSVTAFRRYYWNNHYDQDVTPARIIDVVRDEKTRTFQQEFLLSGGTDRFDWTAGLFYFNMKASIQPISTEAAPVSATNVGRFSQSDLDSYAAYAQGSYAVTDALKLTAGVRYTKDKTTLNGALVALPGHPLAAGTILASVRDLDLSASKVTWRFSADYQVTPDVLLYGSISRGFKSGQFNLTSITQIPTDPETLDAYEVGFKSDLLDRRLRINGTAFRYDYKDIQLVQVAPPPINIQTLNAAGARINGAEFEVLAVPPIGAGRLELGATLTLLDAKYTDFPGSPYFVPNPYAAPPPGVTCANPISTAPGGNTSCVTDATGKRMIRAPKWTLGLNADYIVPVGPGDLQLTANYYINDGFYWEPSNRTRQKQYEVLNLQAAYSPADSPWRFRIFARNLTDELYYSSVSEQAVGDLATAQAPRTYGIGIDFRWR